MSEKITRNIIKENAQLFKDGKKVLYMRNCGKTSQMFITDKNTLKSSAKNYLTYTQTMKKVKNNEFNDSQIRFLFLNYVIDFINAKESEK